MVYGPLVIFWRNSVDKMKQLDQDLHCLHSDTSAGGQMEFSKL